MIGTTLSHFRITAKLGEGGMGEVYRAEDTKLERAVAIKVLPAAFTEHPERLARFEREARVLASLNHPNIAAIYEVGEADSLHFLAIELVEGEDLAERLRRGALPADEALDVAIQIADALEVAHARGIVHRDLKPANVKLTAEGRVKVLDFGLAKVAADAAGEGETTRSPTLTAQMTQAGALLGTAAYMSPEQARGEEADRRADIWALGVLLNEMLTGHKTFDEKTVSDTLAAVLKSDPDLSGLPVKLPPEARRLLERCLRKDPNERLRDIGDVGLELREIRARLGEPQVASADPPAEAVAKGVTAWRTAALATLLIAVVGLWMVWNRSPLRSNSGGSPQGTVRFAVPPPQNAVFFRGIAVSPDGSKVAMTVRTERGTSEICVRSLDSLEMNCLAETEGLPRYPFWSPDGREIAFFADYSLQVVDLLGTPARTLVRAKSLSNDARGGSWGNDGTILYAPTWVGGLLRVSADGGEPQPATVLDPASGNGTHRFPCFLPDGRHFLLYASRGGGREPGEIRLGELGSTETRLLTTASSAAVLAPPNHLLFVRGEVLVTQRLDLDGFQLIGTPKALGVELPGGRGVSGLRSLSVSWQGTLAYVPDASSASRLQWVDRKGEVVGEIVDQDIFHNAPRISPDGQTVAVTRYGADTNGGDIWLFDRQRGTGQPFLQRPGDEEEVAWSPDGTRIAYTLTPEGEQQTQQVADLQGRQQQVGPADPSLWMNGWSPDGSRLLLDLYRPEGGGMGIVVLSLDDPDGAPVELLGKDISAWDGELSPDGRLLAYVSDAAGTREVYIRPVDGSQLPWQVSTAGADSPCWSRDGSELYFLALNGWMQAAHVSVADRITTSPPEPLFEAGIQFDLYSTDRQYDVDADGIFLINRRGSDTASPLVVVLGLDRLLEP